MDMSITTTCWASPIRRLAALAILVAVAISINAYRRSESHRTRWLALLAAPLLPPSVAVGLAALDSRWLQNGIQSSGASQPGVIAAGMAEIQDIRLLGLIPGALLAALTALRLWRARATGPKRSTLFMVLPLALVITLLLSSLLAHRQPPVALLLAGIAIALSVFLIVATPQVGQEPTLTAAWLAILIVAVTMAAIIGTAQARIRYLTIAYGAPTG